VRADASVTRSAAPTSCGEGDPIRLAQVFGNPLNDSAKFTAAGGRIQVLVERLAERVAVTVKDNGRGIPRAALGRIFEPFVQAEGDDRRRGGLGLAIVPGLVTRHGVRKRSKTRGSRRSSPSTRAPRSRPGGASGRTRPCATWGCPSSTGTRARARCATNTPPRPRSSRRRATAASRIASARPKPGSTATS
jgi:hypothetical protein